MRVIALILFILTGYFSGAQVLQTTAPFSTATTYLEPDDKQEAVRISRTEFVTITKVRGAYMGPSDFVL
ncbi:MAG: hypothetical protein ACJ75J_17070, partial [Cytophagaceae bacterium]